MSRAIPLFGVPCECGWCQRGMSHFPDFAPPRWASLTRKERRWIRRAAAKQVRRARRRAHRQLEARRVRWRRWGVDIGHGLEYKNKP